MVIMWHRTRWFNKQSPDRAAWIPCEPSSTSKTSAGVSNVIAEVTVRGHLWADSPETAMATTPLATVASCRSISAFPSSQSRVEERLKRIIKGGGRRSHSMGRKLGQGRRNADPPAQNPFLAVSLIPLKLLDLEPAPRSRDELQSSICSSGKGHPQPRE